MHVRSIWRKISVAVVAVVVLVALAVAGIGWYFSDQLMSTSRAVDYDLVAYASDSSSVTITADPDSTRPGVYGLKWPGGHAQIGDITKVEGGKVTRRLTGVRGQVPVGKHVGLDNAIYDGDPKSALDMDFTDVKYESDIGAMPAWYVPSGVGSGNWVIFVHGRGSSRADSLRYLRLIKAQGSNTLAISYRNDVGAPPSPDHTDHLGATEWKDVDASIAYAKTNGAKNITLFGSSMGGAMSMHTLFESSQAASIKAVVLDSPVTSWRNTLDKQGSDRGLPKPITRVAEQFYAWRTGFSFDDFDVTRRAAEIKVPVLLFYGSGDTYVPPGPSIQLAAKRPDLVHLVDIVGAGHTTEWNVNHDDYDTQLRSFLDLSGT